MAKVETTFLEEVAKYDDKGLRDYQAYHKREIYKRWMKVDSVLLQMPTGTGKTRLFVSMIKDFDNYSKQHNKEVRVLIVTHRKELVDQIKRELFWNYNIRSTLITAENKVSHFNPLPVCVASIQTLVRRLDTHWYNYPFDFVIIDEAHHTKAETYKRILKAYPDTKVLGVTATPYRLNGEGFTEEYKDLIVSPSVKRFIEAGWLSNYDYYSIKEDSDLYKGLEDIPLDKYGEYATYPLWKYFGADRIRSEIVGSYLKYAKGKKAIIYTINKAHNMQLCGEFRQCGIIACAIDSDTKPYERKRIIADFRQGKIDVLCNVDIFTEGFDCPDVEVIQLARPTKSLGLYLQQVGRGLRIAAGKRKVMFLDNVGLHNRFGFPASRRMWRKHYLGQEIDESSRFIAKDDDAEPFEMGKRQRDLSEGCEEITLIESTGINEVIDEAKTDYQAEREKRFKQLIEAVYENNRKVYEECIGSYSEPRMIYSSVFSEDIVNPCSFIDCECEDVPFWEERIKQEFKPMLRNRTIVYESFEDVDEYMQTKCDMILSRFKSELSKSRTQLFDELNDYTAEQFYILFASEYGDEHIMTKKMLSFVQHGYANIGWEKMVKMWDSPKLLLNVENQEDDNKEKLEASFTDNADTADKEGTSVVDDHRIENTTDTLEESIFNSWTAKDGLSYTIRRNGEPFDLKKKTKEDMENEGRKTPSSNAEPCQEQPSSSGEESNTDIESGKKEPQALPVEKQPSEFAAEKELSPNLVVDEQRVEDTNDTFEERIEIGDEIRTPSHRCGKVIAVLNMKDGLSKLMLQTKEGAIFSFVTSLSNVKYVKKRDGKPFEWKKKAKDGLESERRKTPMSNAVPIQEQLVSSSEENNTDIESGNKETDTLPVEKQESVFAAEKESLLKGNTIGEVIDEQLPFSVGDRIEHSTWGKGVVKEIVLGGSLIGVSFDGSAIEYVKPNVISHR